MNDAVIIGHGMVGKSVAHAFAIDKWIDPKGSTSSYKEAGASRYIFLCLPTPTKDGLCDTSLTREAINAVLDHSTKQNIFIIRSTVVPGTTRALIEHFGTKAIVHNPEFLSEDTWQKDVEHPDIVVLGGENNVFLDDVEAVYRGRFKGLDVIKTDSLTSEMIKYSINGFYGLKVVYANQVFDHAQKIGANYETIKRAMYKRKWIGGNHLDIFHKGGRGAGGKCLQKDLEAFTEWSQLSILKEANKVNKSLLSNNPKQQ